jgi:hypothetical protein
MKGEKFEDVKGVIRSKNTVTKRKGTERQNNCSQNTKQKTRNLQIEQREHH